MIIDCISDLHGFLPELEGGDLLIIAGDHTASDKLTEWAEFFHWLKKQDYKKKILIAGNHDGFMENGFPKNQKEAHDLQEVREFLEEIGEQLDTDFQYLCDSGTEFEGLNIWGTPWTKTFPRMNSKCKAFTVDTEEELMDKFKIIPNNIDILISHGPISNILDENFYFNKCGSHSLGRLIFDIKPSYHIFGHIHEQGGKTISLNYENKFNCTHINCSHVNEKYKPVNTPIRIELQFTKGKYHHTRFPNE
ncbi:MAG: metallophosphoesterase, partial [Nanoarchaeota archaeon]